MRIAIIGINYFPSILKRCYLQLSACGHQVKVFGQQEAKKLDDLIALGIDIAVLSFGDFRRLYESVKEFSPEYIFSLSEPYLMLAARLRHELDLPGNSPQIEDALLNKPITRSILVNAGLSNVRSERCGIDDLEVCIAGFDEEVIVKPPAAVGSIGVFALNPQDVDKRIFNAIRNRYAAIGAYGLDGFYIESRIRGKEIIADGIVANSVCCVLGFTHKRTSESVEFVSKGHTVFTSVDPHEAVLRNYVAEVVAALGINNCFFHIEMFDLGSGVYEVIEAHSRLGGDRIPELIEDAFGIQVYASLFNHMESDIAKNIYSDVPPEHVRKHQSIEFFYSPEGRVEQIHDLNYLKMNPQFKRLRLFLSEGDRVVTTTHSKARVAYVAFESVSMEEHDAYLSKLNASELISLERNKLLT